MRQPVGVNVLPAIFQKAMVKVVGNLLEEDAFVYPDDIAVHTHHPPVWSIVGGKHAV